MDELLEESGQLQAGDPGSAGAFLGIALAIFGLFILCIA